MAEEVHPDFSFNGMPLTLKHQGYTVEAGGRVVGIVKMGNSPDMRYSANTCDGVYPHKTDRFVGWYPTIEMAVGAIAGHKGDDISGIERDIQKAKRQEEQDSE